MVKISFLTRALVAMLLLAVLVSPCTAAQALTFTALSQLQQYLENHSPSQSMAAGTHYADLEGTIASITWAGANNHYDMILLVEDSRALNPVGSESPKINVHFRLHKDEPPFKVGDTVTVFGSLNELYSSVIVPSIIADYINGSDDF